MPRSHQCCSQRVVRGRIVGTQTHRRFVFADRGVEFVFGLQHRRQIVVRFEVAGILLHVVARQRLLQHHARIALRRSKFTGSTCSHKWHISSLDRLPPTTRAGG